MSYTKDGFASLFQQLTGHPPYPWQTALFDRLSNAKQPEDVPSALDIPTGLGKTSVMTIWLLARPFNPQLPRRLIYVVDRRAVVDQATEEAVKLADTLSALPDVSKALGIEGTLPVSTLRGQFADNRKWSENPTQPAIVVSTVDMMGSRLLFSGYRLSRKQWPVHAGLLAHDSLIVLDEAHLNQPFHGLLKDMGEIGRPHDGLPQVSNILSLSATGAVTETAAALTLSDADMAHPRVQGLLTAPKPLTIRVSEGRLPEQLADEAWRLATQADVARRVLVFCNHRDDAGKTADALRKKLNEFGKPEKKAYGDSHLNLLVGERRVYERENLRKSLLYKAFLDDKSGEATFDTAAPAFIVATSAGEVGIDLDAQGMVCDLVTWERMVQRLGRVNRRGSPVPAPVIVIDTPDDRNAARQAACRSLLEALPETDGVYDASVGAIRALKATHDVTPASTPAPLRPKLTLPVVEGWALTSLQETHTGSPDLTPYLRGWIEDDDPQCEVFWRAFIPWRNGEHQPDAKVLSDWLDAAPPHLSEMLEAPVRRVMDVLKKQFKNAPFAYETQGTTLQKGCVLLLDKRGTPLNQWTHSAFAALLNDSGKLSRFLVGNRLLLQADIGGLGAHGLLDETGAAVTTLDTVKDWAEDLGLEFTVTSDAATARKGSRFHFPMAGLDDVKAGILSVHRKPATDTANENTAISRHAQTLKEHQEWAANMADRMAQDLNLPDDLRQMLRVSVAHHDAGKAHPEWQSSMGAPKDDIYAKTTGAGTTRKTNGYRHELGSLLDPQVQAALADLPEALRDLALHLITAHHGHARPYINPFIPRAPGTPYNLPASLTPRLALETALRFARVQKRWGPWGLAWWEAVFRAADARASYWNDRRDTLPETVRLVLEAAR